jgi:ELWxxDGT repeat protein
MKSTVLSFLLLLTCSVFSQSTKLLENTQLFGYLFNGKPLMFDMSGNLWTTDGTPAGTKIFTTKVKMALAETERSGEATILGSKFYFAGQATGTGVELWCTDGTDAGTYLVKEITTGPASTELGDFFVVNNRVCFGANDGMHGYELWITDGTSGGTKLLKDLTGDANGSKLDGASFASAAILNSNAYFFADDSLHGYELWKTDGTTAGTKMVKDINPDNAGEELNSYAITVFGNALYFFFDDGVNGTQLWRSDGTEPGTAIVKNITATNGSTLLNPDLHIFNNKLYFDAKNGVAAELWMSDGTANGTTRLKTFSASLFSNTIDLSGAVNFQGKFLFNYSYSSFGNNTVETVAELWTSDGTANNTKKIFTAPPSNSIFVSYKGDAINTPFSGKVFFSTVNTQQFTGKLWITDGTEVGTTTVFNNLFGYFSNTMYGATNFYFWGAHSTAADSISLYKTDGTVAGNRVIQSYPKPQLNSATMFPFMNFEYNGDLYYHADDKKDNSNANDFYRTGTGGVVPPPPPPPATYTFTGNGSWDTPSNWLNNQMPPANLTSGEVIIDPVTGGECVISGGKTLAPGVKLTIKSNKKLRVTN